MPHARIFQKPKNAMQSGRARTNCWVLEFEPSEAKRADPLTGWAGSGDTRGQLSLSFATLEAAQAYAAKNAISATVIAAPVRVLKLQAYADNFR
jgi:ETC complex I subunit conserved region